MSDFIFNCDELCNIIEVCNRNSVSTFKGLGLEINFSSNDKGDLRIGDNLKSSSLPNPYFPPFTPNKEEYEGGDEFSVEDSNIEEELAILHLENPELFEELLSKPEMMEQYENMLKDKHGK